MTALRVRFGRLLAFHRKKRKLTQEALAAAAGLSVDMISRMESGGTGARFATIEKLSAALEIDAAELFAADFKEVEMNRPALRAVTARLMSLSDRELKWAGELLDKALEAKG